VFLVRSRYFFHSARIPVFRPPRSLRKGNGKRRNTEDRRFTAKVPLQKIMSTTNSPRTSWRNKERNFCASSKCNKRRIEDFAKCYCVSEIPFPKSKLFIFSLMTVYLSQKVPSCYLNIFIISRNEDVLTLILYTSSP